MMFLFRSAAELKESGSHAEAKEVKADLDSLNVRALSWLHAA